MTVKEVKKGWKGCVILRFDRLANSFVNSLRMHQNLALHSSALLPIKSSVFGELQAMIRFKVLQC